MAYIKKMFCEVFPIFPQKQDCCSHLGDTDNMETVGTIGNKQKAGKFKQKVGEFICTSYVCFTKAMSVSVASKGTVIDRITLIILILIILSSILDSPSSSAVHSV